MYILCKNILIVIINGGYYYNVNNNIITFPVGIHLFWKALTGSVIMVAPRVARAREIELLTCVTNYSSSSQVILSGVEVFF